MVDQEGVVWRANNVCYLTHESQVVAPKAWLQPFVRAVCDGGGLSTHSHSKVFQQSDHIEAVLVHGIGTVRLMLKRVRCATWKSWRAKCRVRGQERNIEMKFWWKAVRQ